MTINLQLVEIPEHEQVQQRQVALPESGGTIGRTYDCTLQLPDFQRQLSRIHAEISRDPRGGYQVTDHSTNGLWVNGRLLGRGRQQRLGDGDILRLGGYSLLVSDLSSLLGTRAEPVDEAPAPQAPMFDLDNLGAADTAWPLEEPDTVAFEPDTGTEFSRHNVMADDPFGPDPFDDDCELPPPERSSRADLVTLDQAPSAGESQALHASLQALTRLMEQQQRQALAPLGQDKLMDCLQRTLDRFLEELSPAHLEEIFSDFGSGWGSRDKKYWRLYRKQFNRKLDRREFHHRFTALFVEELRGKG